MQDEVKHWTWADADAEAELMLMLSVKTDWFWVELFQQTQNDFLFEKKKKSFVVGQHFICS